MLFSADTPMKTLMKHINEQPEIPSKRSELNIPPELDALVMECLEKDRTNRPNNAEDLLAKLKAIPFDRPWENEDARRWWDTNQPA